MPPASGLLGRSAQTMGAGLGEWGLLNYLRAPPVENLIRGSPNPGGCLRSCPMEQLPCALAFCSTEPPAVLCLLVV